MDLVRNYRDLIVWQKAMDLTVKIYQITRSFPKEEIYGLTSQIRRAAVSIPSNIAEGQARKSTQEFLHFLSIANGSRAEVETQVIIAKRLRYVDEIIAGEIFDLLSEISSLTHGLINSLKKK
jgi:four helix bundle protein